MPFRTNVRVPWCALFCATLGSLPLLASSTFKIGDPVNVGTGSCDPFGCPTLFKLNTYQQIYASSAFPDTVIIQQLTFYNTQVLNAGLIAAGTYTFSLSYTTKSPGNLDLNNPNNNISGSSQTFYTGSLPSLVSLPNKTRAMTITGTPYTYDPTQGNLLLTVAVSGAKDHTPNLYLDVALTMAQTSYAYFGKTNGGNDGGGLVTGITVLVPFNTIYNFTGSTDAANPYSGVLIGSTGTIYGTSYNGGANQGGAVFAVTTPVVPGINWGEHVLYSFAGAGDGYSPAGGLISDSAGILYGTTAHGGAGQNGTVFSLAPPSSPGGTWTHTVLYSFGGTGDGANPFATLVADANGNLYGTTVNGGAAGHGAVFELAPPASSGGPWTETVLYSFAGGSDGAAPYAGLTMDASGNLYGTTTGGGAGFGTAFELSPSGLGGWNETLLHSFSGGRDGANPLAGICLGPNGVVYGATDTGGASGKGTVFQLSPPSSGSTWTEAVLHSFSGNNGDAGPYATPILGSDGSLYGTTTGSGTTGFGTVYRLKPPVPPNTRWTEIVLYSFQGGTDGANPKGSLVLAPDGSFYGTAFDGGSGYGGVFQAAAVN